MDVLARSKNAIAIESPHGTGGNVAVLIGLRAPARPVAGVPATTSFQGGCSATTDVLEAGQAAELAARYSGSGDSDLLFCAQAGDAKQFYHILPYIEQANVFKS